MIFWDFSYALAQQIIISKFKDATDVHVLPDRYDTKDSLKGSERDGHNQGKPPEIQIRGQAIKMTSSLRSYLLTNENKTNLIQFIISE